MTTAPAPSPQHVPDSVENAIATPEKEQPYGALGLKDDEYARIKEILGRRPTSGELAMYSVMWSEHCSYKSSKNYLRRFGQKVSDEMRERLMVGMGQNAGVVDVGEGWAVTFKAESHNHPSFIEPFQGAATGVGGIVRDIISMGARPVAVMDALRFGAIDHPDTARVVHGVTSGISFYGNCLGLPNIGGETVFDSVYQANPLVNALAVGVLRHEDLKLANATGVGNKVVLFGARTGGDGIGGASILASDTFADGGPTKRPAVQVGDPFAEKVLIECCLELYRGELVEAIQDLGAAGISCATSELAANGNSGMHVSLDNVLLRDPTLTAEEILMSESQERMMAIVAPEKLDAFLAVVNKWEVETSVLGEVTGDGRLIIDWQGERIVDVDPSTVAVDGPVYDRPVAYPTWIDALQADAAENLPRANDAETLREQFLALVASPNLADTSWITNQYDYYVLGNTALSFPDDAGMIRVDEESGLGFSVATDANGRYCQLDPYAGAQLALAEAYRNVAVTGAVPTAITDCLNFGSPRTPRSCGSSGRPSTASQTAATNWALRSPAATSRSTTRPAMCRSTRPRSSACWASSTTSPAASRPDGRTRGRTSICSAPPRPSSPAPRGPRSCTSTSAAARRRSTSRARSASPDCSPPPGTSGSSPRRTTSPKVVSRRPWPRASCASASVPASGSTRSSSATAWTPRPPCSPSRPAA